MGLLTACLPVESPKPLPIGYQLDTGGIDVSARGQRVDFGRTDHSAISAMTKLVGSAPDATGGCAAVSWAQWDRVTLYFNAGDFRGWRTDDRSAGVICS